MSMSQYLFIAISRAKMSSVYGALLFHNFFPILPIFNWIWRDFELNLSKSIVTWLFFCCSCPLLISRVNQILSKIGGWLKHNIAVLKFVQNPTILRINNIFICKRVSFSYNPNFCTSLVIQINKQVFVACSFVFFQIQNLVLVQLKKGILKQINIPAKIILAYWLR